MMGVILVVATAVLLANLITDICYALADPRVRLGERV
jgi:ABC-type dipeptide/oligopeptide/nickel transport system permease component